MPNVRTRRLSYLISAALAAVLISYVAVFALQPPASEAAAAAARARCREHGWPQRLAPRMYSDTGSTLTQGFIQQFVIEGTDPLMEIWVEVRRSLYAPVWRVAQIIETEVDLKGD